jgi:hypothetical protein
MDLDTGMSFSRFFPSIKLGKQENMKSNSAKIKTGHMLNASLQHSHQMKSHSRPIIIKLFV